MKRYRRYIFMFDTFFVFIMITLIILYGHLIGFYVTHTLFIVFIFIIIMSASLYVHDVIRKRLHRLIIGTRVVVHYSSNVIRLPKTITVNEIRKKNHQLVYRYQGFSIPICFVEHVDQEKAYLFPFYEENTSISSLCDILENYRYEYFLVKDSFQKKYIINRAQVLSIE